MLNGVNGQKKKIIMVNVKLKTRTRTVAGTEVMGRVVGLRLILKVPRPTSEYDCGWTSELRLFIIYIPRTRPLPHISPIKSVVHPSAVHYANKKLCNINNEEGSEIISLGRHKLHGKFQNIIM